MINLTNHPQTEEKLFPLDPLPSINEAGAR